MNFACCPFIAELDHSFLFSTPGARIVSLISYRLDFYTSTNTNSIMTSRQNYTSGDVAALLPKFGDLDPDIRYMSLVDLSNILDAGSTTLLLNDPTTAARVVDCLLASLDDTNGDVQSQALKRSAEKWGFLLTQANMIQYWTSGAQITSRDTLPVP